MVHGRSDATLNRLGVRMGSAEIYTAVEGMPEVGDCLVVGVEQDDGGYWMPLFVTLADGAELDDGLRSRIVAAIRQHASPRHVPDDILAVPGYRGRSPANGWKSRSSGSCSAPRRARPCSRVRSTDRNC